MSKKLEIPNSADLRRSMLILILHARALGMWDIVEMYSKVAIRLGTELLASGEKFNDPTNIQLWLDASKAEKK